MGMVGRELADASWTGVLEIQHRVVSSVLLPSVPVHHPAWQTLQLRVKQVWTSHLVRKTEVRKRRLAIRESDFSNRPIGYYMRVRNALSERRDPGPCEGW
jgi:hypothetical protein